MKRCKLERTPYPSSSPSSFPSFSSNSIVHISLSSTLLLSFCFIFFVFLPSGIHGELSSITVNSATSSQPFQPISTPYKSFLTLNRTKDGYYLTARVGTPGLTVRLVLDTSSITYLVSATTCSSKTSVHCFDTKKSLTYDPCNDSCRGSSFSVHDSECSAGSGSDAFTLLGVTPSPPGQVYTALNFHFCLTYLDLNWFEGEGFDGILGLQAHDPYLPSADVTWLFGNSPGIGGSYFALDLNRSNNNTALQIGGWDLSYNLTWSSEQQVRSLQNLEQEFMLYHLSICGVDLLEGIGSFTIARLQTTYQHLALPPSILPTVINWINGRCSSAADSSEKLIECYFPYDWSYISSNFRQILPVLTFRLSEDGIELNLPLEEFIQEKKVIVGQFGNETHLTFNVGVNPYASSSSVIIIFGLPAIETLYTVFDYTHTRIAFGQRPQHIFEDSQVKRGGCKARTVCAIGKTYNPQTNACMDPACHVYYFQELDPETYQCRLKPGMITFVIVLVVVLSLLEIGMAHLYIKLFSSIQRTFPAVSASTHTHSH